MSNETYPKTETAEGDEERLNPWSERVISLVRDERFRSYTKGLYQRETHSKAGEHVFVVYNAHLSKDMDAECFVQVLPGDRGQEAEKFQWFEGEGPEASYPDSLNRIDELLSLFRPIDEETGGEA